MYLEKLSYTFGKVRLAATLGSMQHYCLISHHLGDERGGGEEDKALLF